MLENPLINWSRVDTQRWHPFKILRRLLRLSPWQAAGPLFETLNITPNPRFNVAPGKNLERRTCHPDPKAEVQQIGDDSPETADSEAAEVCRDASNHRAAERAPYLLQFHTIDWGRGVSEAGLTVVNYQWPMVESLDATLPQ